MMKKLDVRYTIRFLLVSVFTVFIGIGIYRYIFFDDLRGAITHSLFFSFDVLIVVSLMMLGCHALDAIRELWRRNR